MQCDENMQHLTLLCTANQANERRKRCDTICANRIYEHQSPVPCAWQTNDRQKMMTASEFWAFQANPLVCMWAVASLIGNQFSRLCRMAECLQTPRGTGQDALGRRCKIQRCSPSDKSFQRTTSSSFTVTPSVPRAVKICAVARVLNLCLMKFANGFRKRLTAIGVANCNKLSH